jgi:uncharacterized protein (DUF488 family)
VSRYTIYTIGHSTHPVETFIEYLDRYQINCVIDVRSMPYSKYNPQYNKELLQAALTQKDILYAHFGLEFGARHTSKAMLDAEGRVDFNKVRASDTFRQGLVRLENALDQGYRIVLMCSEKDPLACHRFSMICYYLKKEGYEINHILDDGSIITNAELEKRMIQKYQKHIPQNDLFTHVTEEEQIDAAYHLCGRDVAYLPDKPRSMDEDENTP